MARIFGISSLPVSTIGDTIKPFKELVTIPYLRKVSYPLSSTTKLSKTPINDGFVKTKKMPNYKIIK